MQKKEKKIDLRVALFNAYKKSKKREDRLWSGGEPQSVPDLMKEAEEGSKWEILVGRLRELDQHLHLTDLDDVKPESEPSFFKIESRLSEITISSQDLMAEPKDIAGQYLIQSKHSIEQFEDVRRELQQGFIDIITLVVAEKRKSLLKKQLDLSSIDGMVKIAEEIAHQLDPHSSNPSGLFGDRKPVESLLASTRTSTILMDKIVEIRIRLEASGKELFETKNRLGLNDDGDDEREEEIFKNYSFGSSFSPEPEAQKTPKKLQNFFSSVEDEEEAAETVSKSERIINITESLSSSQNPSVLSLESEKILSELEDWDRERAQLDQEIETLRAKCASVRNPQFTSTSPVVPVASVATFPTGSNVVKRPPAIPPYRSSRLVLSPSSRSPQKPGDFSSPPSMSPYRYSLAKLPSSPSSQSPQSQSPVSALSPLPSSSLPLSLPLPLSPHKTVREPWNLDSAVSSPTAKSVVYLQKKAAEREKSEAAARATEERRLTKEREIEKMRLAGEQAIAEAVAREKERVAKIEAAALEAEEKLRLEKEAREAEEKAIALAQKKEVERKEKQAQKVKEAADRKARLEKEEKATVERERLIAEEKLARERAKAEAEALALAEQKIRLEEEERQREAAKAQDAEKLRLELMEAEKLESERVAKAEAEAAASEKQRRAEARAKAQREKETAERIAEWERLVAIFSEPSSGNPSVQFIMDRDYTAVSERDLSFSRGDRIRAISFAPDAAKASAGNRSNLSSGAASGIDGGEQLWVGERVAGPSSSIGTFCTLFGNAVVAGPLEKKGMGDSVLFAKPFALRECEFNGVTGVFKYSEGGRSKSVIVNDSCIVAHVAPTAAEGRSFAFSITCDRLDDKGKKSGTEKNSLLLTASSESCRAWWVASFSVYVANRRAAPTRSSAL